MKMRFQLRSLALVLVILSVSSQSSAMIFDMNLEKFAAYFRANYAPTTSNKATYEKSSPFSEVYTGDLTVIYGAEFGFVYSTRFLNIRFGLDVIRPPTLKVEAANVSGTKLYDLTSDISAITPKIGIEYNVRQWKNSRIFLNANYGQSTLGLNNAYAFTASGAAAPIGGVDHTEEGRASATLIEESLGYEVLMFDTTTVVFDLGYRSLKFASITHNRDATTLQGAKVKGDAMLNTDGTNRQVDLTGYYAGIQFRFWVF